MSETERGESIDFFFATELVIGVKGEENYIKKNRKRET